MIDDTSKVSSKKFNFRIKRFCIGISTSIVKEVQNTIKVVFHGIGNSINPHYSSISLTPIATLRFRAMRNPDILLIRKQLKLFVAIYLVNSS